MVYNIEEQFRMIREGKLYLDSLFNTKINIFCSPWNQADENTLKALTDNNDEVFSGYLYSPATKGSKALNTTSNLFDGPLGTVEDAFLLAAKSSYTSKHVLLFHSSYDFNENNLFKLDSLFSVLSSKQEFNISNIDYWKESLISDRDFFLFNQMFNNDNNMLKMRILKFGFRKVGINLNIIRDNKIKQYQESIWAGDFNKQFIS